MVAAAAGEVACNNALDVCERLKSMIKVKSSKAYSAKGIKYRLIALNRILSKINQK